jgi:hypothetical protein
MLVPLSRPNVPWLAGSDERMFTPGAEMSGFIWRETGVGPADEKSAITLRWFTAATVIASGALPGEETDP